jgi:hypothetical protein
MSKARNENSSVYNMEPEKETKRRRIRIIRIFAIFMSLEIEIGCRLWRSADYDDAHGSYIRPITEQSVATSAFTYQYRALA